MIQDFYKDLPQETFTLAEWINFVELHPEYLTINSQVGQNGTSQKELSAITLSLTRGLVNVKDTLSPIEILKEKLTRARIIEAQKREFAEIYETCLAAPNFEAEMPGVLEVNNKYKLVSDLLMIDKDFHKILVPPSMRGILLSYTHLLGHKGLNRMIADLQSYYFPKMNTITKQFIQCCYGCFLTNKGNRKSKIGIYPTPSYPFEEITMDLAENLNTISGYSHLLISQCALTDFVIIIPLKSKLATEVNRGILNGIFQQFNVKRIHTDNGPCFRSNVWLEVMAALNIQIIGSSALHPSGRGQIERLVGTIKIMLKRMLAIKTDLNWEYLPYLCAKILNNTTSPKTNFKPQEMVFGNQGAGLPNFSTESFSHAHPNVRNNKQHIEKITQEIQQMTQAASEKLTQLRMLTNEKLNKNRISKEFKINDYVFVLDRYNMPGNTRPLKTKFHPSPYIVIRPLWTTTLVKRLADGFIALYSNDDLKRYDGKSPLFANIPKEISRVLLHDFQDLLESDISVITKHDPLDIPSGIELFEQDQFHPTQDTNLGEENDISQQVEKPDPKRLFQEPLQDEFEPEDKNLTPPDEMTPSLQPQPPTSNGKSNNTGHGTTVPHDNPVISKESFKGINTEESLQELLRSEENKVRTRKDNKDELGSDESDPEPELNDDNDTQSLDNNIDSDSVRILRSGKRVHF